MGERMSPDAWIYFKKEYPDDVNTLYHIDIMFDGHNILHTQRRRNTKTNTYKKKSNTERHGLELGPIIDWLVDNTNEQYYIDRDHKHEEYNKVIIRFYFFDESDAMAFKMMFGEKT